MGCFLKSILAGRYIICCPEQVKSQSLRSAAVKVTKCIVNPTLIALTFYNVWNALKHQKYPFTLKQHYPKSLVSFNRRYRDHRHVSLFQNLIPNFLITVRRAIVKTHVVISFKQNRGKHRQNQFSTLIIYFSISSAKVVIVSTVNARFMLRRAYTTPSSSFNATIFKTT